MERDTGAAKADGAAFSYQTPPVNRMISIMPLDTISGGVPLLGMARMSAVNFITPGWFSALGTRVVAGRDVTDRDRQGTPPVVVANRAFARKFLNSASPLGHTIATTVGLPGH